MNLNAINSEYCYMLSSIGFASTIGDLTAFNHNNDSGATPSLDIVKQAVSELIRGREYAYNSDERDAVKLGLARLIVCLLRRGQTDEKEDDTSADFLSLFPEIGDEFLFAVVYSTNLTQAVVQVMCELDYTVVERMLEALIRFDADQSEVGFSSLVRSCEQLCKLVANSASVSGTAHALLRHFLPKLTSMDAVPKSAVVISEVISLMDAYADAYCVKDRKPAPYSALYNKTQASDRTFANLFMLSYGLFTDVDVHPTIDDNFVGLVQLLDRVAQDIDLAKTNAGIDYYTVWTQARRLRQILRCSDDKIVATIVDKVESRVRYRLIKSANFSAETKIEDCLYLVSNGLYMKEIMTILIESMSEPDRCTQIVTFFERNIVLLCDVDYIVRLVKVTRLTRLIARSKRSRNQLCDLTQRVFCKSDVSIQNQVIQQVHKDGAETIGFDQDSQTVAVLNRLTLVNDGNVVSSLTSVAWLLLQKPRQILAEMIVRASTNADYCKVLVKLLEKLPSVGLLTIVEQKVKLTNLVFCFEHMLNVELSELQVGNLVALVTSLLSSSCLDVAQLVLEIVFRSLNVDSVCDKNRAPLNFSLAVLDTLLKRRLLMSLVTPAAVISVLYCLCEVVDFCGRSVWQRQHGSIREQAKYCVHNLAKLWRRENFDSRVATWLQQKLESLESATQFLFLDFEPYPQRRLKTTLVKATVDFLQATTPQDTHGALLVIFSVAVVSDTSLDYFLKIEGRRQLPYSVLVTALVQRAPHCTGVECRRLCRLVTTWLRRATVRIGDVGRARSDTTSTQATMTSTAVMTLVSKTWLDAVLVMLHPDVGWMDEVMKVCIVRNYAVILKLILTEAAEGSDQDMSATIVLHALEALSKMDEQIAESLLILILDSLKQLKSSDSHDALARVTTFVAILQLTSANRVDLPKIAASL